MNALRGDIDPDGLLEFSVVFTDRSLNHMSKAFQGVMRDISAGLKACYNAKAVAVVPGGGTYAMEAVARQLAKDETVLVVRNGFFSYRWSQIFAAGGIPAEEIVMKARREGNAATASFAPAPVEEVVARIKAEAPALVFAPHVETASGMILPDDYIREISKAVHEVGGLMVLDCIASGCIWVDMEATGVDVLISAPQKGWSAPPSAGLVMLSARAEEKVAETKSDSFACDLGKWLAIMQTYENGGHAYHATMPTDALRVFRDALKETEAKGFDTVKAAQQALGDGARNLMARKGLKSVAAEGYGAPGVVVVFTDDPELQTGRAFAAEGVQIAAGVPLMVDEGADYKSFRIGLFGLDKLADVEATLGRLERVLDKVIA